MQEYADKALIKDPESIAAFVELHIEQGVHLEAEKKDIGIVEAIMAPALLRVEFTGRGGHGGEGPGPFACVLYKNQLSPVGKHNPSTLGMLNLSAVSLLLSI